MIVLALAMAIYLLYRITLFLVRVERGQATIVAQINTLVTDNTDNALMVKAALDRTLRLVDGDRAKLREVLVVVSASLAALDRAATDRSIVAGNLVTAQAAVEDVASNLATAQTAVDGVASDLAVATTAVEGVASDLVAATTVVEGVAADLAASHERADAVQEGAGGAAADAAAQSGQTSE